MRSRTSVIMATRMYSVSGNFLSYDRREVNVMNEQSTIQRSKENWVQAVDVLFRRGYSYAQIAEKLGISESSVKELHG